MQNMDTLQLQFAIVGIINGLVHLIILIATIIIFIKKRSLASIVLLLGSVLTGLGFVVGFIYNVVAAKKGTEALLDAQVKLAFFSAFSFSVFGIGLFLLALNFFKKN